jgi:arylsulfatase A-like enzyme
MNYLFASIEDLNDWIEPLGGHPQVRTPNLNRLAARGMVFRNAYAAVPACSPSRTATLFGQALPPNTAWLEKTFRRFWRASRGNAEIR